MKNIQNKIKEMLKENTGIALCDSGGDNNRHWQKNKYRQFENELPINWNEDYIIKNVYHYLNEYLLITDKSLSFQRSYDKFTKDSIDYHLNDMESFMQFLSDNNKLKSDNYIIPEDGYTKTTNTYNSENLLSQILQYILFYDGNNYFILLQIHNGCDVRGGYTKPYIFELTDIEEFLINQNSCEVITQKDNSYYTDDGYHFYKDGSTKYGTFAWEDIYREGIKTII